LKEVISYKLDIDEHNQHILFKGKELIGNEILLRNFGVTARSVIYVITNPLKPGTSTPITIIIKYGNL
jgi:hypothetical protein